MMRCALGHEAGAGDLAGAGGDAGFWVEVAGYLAGVGLALFRVGLVTEQQPFGGEGLACLAGDALWRQRIVVAAHPDQAGGVADGGQGGVVGGGEAGGGVRVVKTVTDGDQRDRRVARDEGGEARQRGVRVPRWHELAACGAGRAFFEVQVGHRQEREAWPDQHAGRVQQQVFAAERESVHGWGGGSGSGPTSIQGVRSGATARYRESRARTNGKVTPGEILSP